MELFVKAAYHELFGDSKSPDVKLFTLLKDPATWNSLELNNFRPPLIPRAYKDNVEPLLSFIKVGEDDKDGHSLDFFLFLPAQLRLRELIGEEEKLQEIDALAHPTGMIVCSRSAQLENVAAGWGEPRQASSW